MARGCRRRWSRPSVLLVLAGLLTGCTEPGTSPTPDAPSTSDASPSVDRALSPGPGKWTGLAAKCPDLKSHTARALGVAGEGRPTPSYTTIGANVIADCRWGSDDGRGLAVELRMSIYRSQAAADAMWRVLRTGQTETLTGVGDEAFSRLEPSNVAVRMRSENVVATLRVVAPAEHATADQLRKLQPAAIEISKDVLDDLR